LASERRESKLLFIKGTKKLLRRGHKTALRAIISP
jgi:hypothetical protein